MTLDWSPIDRDIDRFRDLMAEKVRAASAKRGHEMGDDLEVDPESMADEYGESPWALQMLAEVASGRG